MFHYLGTYGAASSRKRYDELIGIWLAHGRKLPVAAQPEPAPVTVAEVLAEYWAHAEKKHGKRRNAVKTLSHIKRAISLSRQHFEALPAASFGTVALEQLRGFYIADGLSRSTVNLTYTSKSHAMPCAPKRKGRRLPPTPREGSEMTGAVMDTPERYTDTRSR